MKFPREVSTVPRTSTRSRVLLLALCSGAFAPTVPHVAAQVIPTHWTRIGPPSTAITNYGVVTVDPRDPLVIFFASRGPDGTRTGEDGTEGTWKTTDGGVTWNRIAAVYGSSVNSPWGIKVHPRAPDRLFVGQEDVPRAYPRDVAFDQRRREDLAHLAVADEADRQRIRIAHRMHASRWAPGKAVFEPAYGEPILADSW